MTSPEPGISPLEIVTHPLKARVARVAARQELSPGLLRVTVTGDDLADFVSLDASDDMKLIIPYPDQDLPDLPTIVDSRQVWPEGIRPPIRREYTPRAFDPHANSLTIDFVVHGDGPASAWAANAEIGRAVGIVGPKRSRIVRAEFDWFLMIGDETGLPSIARRLESMAPGTRAIAIVEVDGPANEQQIRTAADATILWAHRNGVHAGRSDALEQAVRSMIFPAGSFFVWAGSEATTLRPIRRHLLDDRGARQEWSRITGHWKAGVSDHDHHESLAD